MANKPEVTTLLKENPVETAPGEEPGKSPFHSMHWFFLLMITMAVIPWLFGDYEVWGFKITGWTWVIPASFTVLICFKNIGRIAFPVFLWLPWTGLLSIFWFFGRENPDALQSFLQILSPLVVACAASIFRPSKLQLEFIIKWMTRLAWILWIVLLIRVPVILTGVLPGHSFMAAEMIGLLLLAASYAAFYACGSHKHIYYYAAMVAVTVIAQTRGPIVAMLSCLPLTPAPLRKRVLLCAALVVCAFVLFNTDLVQQRMFFSGSGTLADLYWDNPNLQKSGRDTLHAILWPGVEDSPWFGNGFNSYRVAFGSFGLPTALVHNDWLKLLHDMGLIGTAIYLLSLIFQTMSLARMAKSSSGPLQLLAYGAATAFIPYALIMLTDNVLLYVQFFGNLHFALIGIIYGAVRREKGDGDV